MRLLLISDDVMLKKRWADVFSNMNPVAFSAFSEECEGNSIVFVSDTVLSNLSQTAIKNLFSRRVMVLSNIPDFQMAQKYLQLGAMGYGNAMMHGTHLRSAFQALEEGNVWLHPDFIAHMMNEIREYHAHQEKTLGILDILSSREREVALMLSDGSTHQEIADALNITVRTVKAHATSIYQKLNVKDRLALSLLLHS